MPKGWQHFTWRAGLWDASGSLWTRLVQRQQREFSVTLVTMATGYILWDRSGHKAFLFDNSTAETSRVSP
jgi:hypothetical protein